MRWPWLLPASADSPNRGRTHYICAKSPVIGVFQRGAKGIAFRVDELLPHFVGEGATAEGAYREWCEYVHVFIQRMSQFRRLSEMKMRACK